MLPLIEGAQNIEGRYKHLIIKAPIIKNIENKIAKISNNKKSNFYLYRDDCYNNGMRTFITHPEQERVQFVVSRLGANLRLARKRRHLTQEEVANKIGVSLPTYRGMEAGKLTVSIGHMISAFVVMGLEDDFMQIAAPEADLVGLAASKGKSQPKSQSKSIDNDF